MLVLSKRVDIQISEDLITYAITSKHRKSVYSMTIDNQDIEDGSLPITSTILNSKLFTIEKGLVLKQIAKLDGKTLKQVKTMFCEMI